jgi:hypothetical protein
MSDTEDKHISDLYSQMNRQQPSEMVDARIRHMARQQLDQQLAAQKTPVRSTSHRWQWLSVAAVMVLSVGVVLRVFEQSPDVTVLDDAADSEMAPALESIVKPAIMDKYRVAEPVLSVEAQKSKRSLPSAPVAEQAFGGQAVMPRQKASDYESGMLVPERELSADSAAKHNLMETLSHAEKKEQASDEALQCADEVLLASRDLQVWLERIKALRADGNEEQARCLEMLMEQVFAE